MTLSLLFLVVMPVWAADPEIDRLLQSPAGKDWVTNGGSLTNQRYSTLNQINTSNVKQLKGAWMTRLKGSGAAGKYSFEASPLVKDGVMYVITGNDDVFALRAKTGEILWEYWSGIDQQISTVCCGWVNRGLAMGEGMLFLGQFDANVVALDVKTGKEVWTAKVEDYKKGYYMSLAPLVIDGKVLIGVSGGELGVRGFVAAYDAQTGKELWKAYMVPAPGEPGSETWPQGDQWKTGGASVWVTGTYDPETNLTFWGTGNGGPWMGDQRPGDNLYTSSVVALDASTGQIKGHFQYHQNDSWDWDEVSPPIVVDFQRDGRTIKGLVNVARNGYLWHLERTSDRINFVAGQPFVRHNVFKGVDPKTGRPDIDEARKPGTNKTAEFCPGLWGGKDWPPAAFSPRTRLIYIPANENLCTELTGELPKPYEPGQRYTGFSRNVMKIVEGADHIGELQAWNVDTGKREWTTNMPGMSQMWGPVLATGGGVLFAGGTNDRMFRAYDAKTGKILWEFPMASGVTGVPVSFQADGQQYIAVQSGWGVDSARMQARLNLLFPGKYQDVPQGGSVSVFAVKGP